MYFTSQSTMELALKVLVLTVMVIGSLADYDPDDKYTPPITCALVDCAPGYTCKMIDGKPKCIPVSGSCDFSCADIFDPVCGSDKKTYPNACELRRAACQQKKVITVASKGACPPTSCAALLCALPKVCQVVNGFAKCVCNRICTLQFDPVCGSDGVTYGNLCELHSKACTENKKITVVSKGECPKASCAAVSCVLPKVCEVINGRAQCVCPRFCPAVHKPLCGSDGKTYSNLCFLNIAACKDSSIKQVGAGPCPTPPTKKPCPDVCIQLYDPVCGSDNKTYSNACFLGIEQCKNNPGLHILYRGKCVPGCEGKKCPGKHSSCHMVQDKPTCVRVCHPCPIQNPSQVCGSDGKTYDSKCELERAACKSQKKITVAHVGACKPPSITCANVLCKIHTVCKMIKGKPHCISTCPKACAKIYRPVCGSNGVLYGNKCLMKMAACKQEKIITAVSMSKCKNVCSSYKCSWPPHSKCEIVHGKPRCVCKFMCSSKQDLVCGSDGKRYDNVCQMKKTACISRMNITVASKALCKDPCFHAKPCTSPPYSSCRAVDGKATCVCPKFCTLEYAPVCGSDGRTYSNRCMMESSSCSQNKLITVKHQGKCDPCRTVKCGFYAVCKVQNGKAVCVCNPFCPKILKPVCGSNGKTYNNECLLRLDSCKTKKHIKVAHQGKCDPCRTVKCGFYAVCKVQYDKAVCVCNPACPKILKPVCGSNGKTYSNECLLRLDSCKTKKHTKVAHQGKCDPCRTVKCGFYAVCKVQYDKAVCVCNLACPKILKPVCGSNGKTYSNECLLRLDSCKTKKHIKVAHQGKCDPCRTVKCGFYAVCKVQNGKAVCVCNPACPKILKPVCGSNGKTYSNECLLRLDSCKTKKHIKVAHQGKCDPCRTVKCGFYAVCKVQNGKAVCVCNPACPKILKPVCGSNGKTYSNECLLRLDSCKTKTHIKVAHQGKCDPCSHAKPCTSPPYSSCRAVDGKATCVCPKFCTLEYAPVCGSDGRTYSNRCMMESSSCSQNKLITVKHQGKCDPCRTVKCGFYATCKVQNDKAVCVCNPICPAIFKPVCGSNGKTYSNECQLRLDSCKTKTYIKVAHQGKCDPCRTVKCGFYAVCKVQYDKAVCVCNLACPKLLKPVCGSNGKTYNNECLLRLDSCKTKKHIKVAYEGPCAPVYME